MHQREYISNLSPRIPSAMGAFKPPQLANTIRGKETGNEYWAADLHHLAAYHDGPSKPHLYGNPRAMELGILPVVMAAASAYNAYNQNKQAKEGGASPGGAGGPSYGGPTTGMQQPGGSATTVSPTIQTEISPNIAPVFSQMQDSAGATQAATTTQFKPGGMEAQGGSATSQPAPLPGMPGSMPFNAPPSPSYFSGPQKGGGLNYTPLDPRTLSNLPTAGKMIRDMQESKPFNWTPVYVIGGLAITATFVLAFMKQRKGR